MYEYDAVAIVEQTISISLDNGTCDLNLKMPPVHMNHMMMHLFGKYVLVDSVK